MATDKKPAFAGPFGPAQEDLNRCVHCGFCLPHCPTYTQLGLETESPRGRLHIINSISQGRIDPTPTAIAHLDLCLQCRHCEAVCPSGVPFGRIMEAARANILYNQRKAPLSWRLRAFLLRLVILHPRLLKLLILLLRLYQRSGLRPLAERVLPNPLRQLCFLIPPVKGRPFKPALSKVEGPVLSRSPERSEGKAEGAAGILAQPPGQGNLTVALFLGCIMPEVYGHVHQATVRVLARHRCQVMVPPGQACCGALFAHNGDLPTALRLAKRNLDAFLDTKADAIIVNSAGCGAALKEYSHLLAHDREYAERAQGFSTRVKDITEFLAQLPLQAPTGAIEAEVTYQDSCHLAHAQGIRQQPRSLLGSIPGLRLVEMEHPDRCCGSAGIYNLTNRQMSLQLLDSKIQEIAATGAGIIATANPGCMFQLEAGLRRHKQPGRVVHVIELLDEAYRLSP